MRWISAIGLLFGLALLAPAGAPADGGPVPPLQGGGGIKAAGLPFRYVALAGGHGTTVLERLGTEGARTASAIQVSGRYGIPGVDYNGTTTGLSADGRTLVLAELPGNATRGSRDCSSSMRHVSRSGRGSPFPAGRSSTRSRRMGAGCI